jgi:septum formation inhibitor MinC
MMSRRDRHALARLDALRRTRLRLAEMHLVKADAARVESIRLVQMASEQVIQTAAFCEQENRRLAAELSTFAREGQEGIVQWKRERMRLRERFNEARQQLEQARDIQAERERALDESRRQQRAAMLAVEKLRILISKMG